MRSLERHTNNRPPPIDVSVVLVDVVVFFVCFWTGELVNAN